MIYLEKKLELIELIPITTSVIYTVTCFLSEKTGAEQHGWT